MVMNPCYDYCFLHFGLEYSPERCDETCEFAKAIQENKRLKSKKKAYWMWKPNGMDWNIGAWVCSNCGNRDSCTPTDKKQNPLLYAGSLYCGNCGAKMIGVVRDYDKI